jgi:hypothetical protein
MFFSQVSDLSSLIEANFEETATASCHQPIEIGKNCAIGIEPIGAAIKRDMGIVVSDFNLQTRNRLRFDIGRIGEDKIEWATNRLSPIAGDEPSPLRQTKAPGIAARDRKRVRYAVGGNSLRLRQFRQERQKNRATAGTDIEKRQRFIAPAIAIDETERCLNQRFGVGARHKRIGSDLKLQPPKRLASDDPRHRFAGKPPFNKSNRSRFGRFIDRLIVMQRQPRRIDANGFSNEKAGIECCRCGAMLGGKSRFEQSG